MIIYMQKNNLLLLSLIVILLSSCTQSTLPTPTPNSLATTENLIQNSPSPMLVGGDKDIHGCLGSAGSSWCEVKNKCLRAWEEPCVSDQENLGDLQTAIKEQIVAKRGASAQNLEITVAKIEGDYAQGGAKPSDGEMGGGMWFAARADSKWQLVWDGNGIIECTDLKSYPDFPNSMIPECYDSPKQDMVQR